MQRGPLSAHAARLCRDIPTRMRDFMGPPGACDACGRVCITLDQVGVRCYHCHAGVFMARAWWTFWRVEDRWIGTPREDIDLAELEVERARMGRR